MAKDSFVGVRAGDLDGKPYAKYWNPDMAPVPDHVQDALAHGMSDAHLTFTPEESDRLLSPGYLPLETGFSRMADDRMFVACLTKMPGVTAEMIDWWFAWHPLEDERYKLWHPKEHLSNRVARRDQDDSSLSDREKYIDNPNYASEYVGTEKLNLVIKFAEASTVFDTRQFTEAKIGTAICGTVAQQKTPFNAGRIVHLIRETEEGGEMRSRFWLGSMSFRFARPDSVLNRFLRAIFPVRKIVPDSAGEMMLTHCAEEMNHLASFLPALYRDYHEDKN